MIIHKDNLKYRMNNYEERDFLLKDLGYSNYNDYLKSPLWQKIKHKLLSKQSKCKVCFNQATVLHHIKYNKETLLGETLEHLIPLCKFCHHYIEFDNKNNKETLNKTNNKLSQILKKYSKLRKKQKIKKSKKLNKDNEEFDPNKHTVREVKIRNGNIIFELIKSIGHKHIRWLKDYDYYTIIEQYNIKPSERRIIR